jgi:carboxylesterase
LVSAPTVVPGCEPFRLDGDATGVLMMHGFTGSPSSMRPIGEWLAAQGVSVLAVRLPGHGTSAGDLAATRWTDWVTTANLGLTEIGSRCDRVTIFAQSMGAALALILAARRPGDVAGLALANPYVHDRRLMLVPLGRLFLSSIKGVGSDVSKDVDEVAYDRIPVQALSSLREVLREADASLPRVRAPLLVFRSEQDHVVPKPNTPRVLERTGSLRKELVECPNSFHVISLDRDAPMVRERLIRFARSV